MKSVTAALPGPSPVTVDGSRDQARTRRPGAVPTARPPVRIGGLPRLALTALAALAPLALPVAWAGAEPSPVPAVPGSTTPRAEDPLVVIVRWTESYRRMGSSLDLAVDDDLRPALETLRRRLSGVEAAENEVLQALCDLAAVGGRGSEPRIARGEYEADERESRARSGGRSVLRSALDAPSGAGRGHWLATEVIAGGERHPVARRMAAAEALRGRHWDATLPALFTAAVSPERGLRDAAVRALSGWNRPAVDRFLANQTLRALREPGFLDEMALAEHFLSRRLLPTQPVAVELTAGLGAALASEDWRGTLRRLPMSRMLPDDLALPLLIETLALWIRRGEAGASSRRVEAALVAELELRSHVKLGMSAERWSFWWKATRARAAEGAGGAQGGAGNEQAPAQQARTRASFFGLRPWTDRVVFVIDRSGSMADDFGTANTSRYAEALRQLERLLKELGPRTHFNVVLFSDEGLRWRSELRPATAPHISGALQWARGLPPRGGTQLYPGLAKALDLDPKTREPDLSRLEADTVIVLCDGATSEGPDWARGFLEQSCAEACLQFDCVQIGNRGNGTLEALAEGTGGQFLQVDS